MKIKISVFFLTLAMTFNIVSVAGHADGGISVTLNGTKITFDVPPQIIDDRTMVPLRKIFEAMGASVEWNGDTQTITATKGDEQVIATVNSTTVYINSETKTIDVPPMIIDDRTLVPVRFVAESFGANVNWDGNSKTVIITTSDSISNVPDSFTYGYIKADFGQLNSNAEENGLEGLDVYLDCTLEKIDLINNETSEAQLIGTVKDVDNNTWSIYLNSTTFVKENEFDSIIDKPIILCGSYEGFSDAYQKPVIFLDKLCIKETGDIKSGIGALLGYVASIDENGLINIVDDDSEGHNMDIEKDESNIQYDFSSEEGIEKYLTDNYSVLNIPSGEWEFSFSVLSNGGDNSDYVIFVEYDQYQMLELEYGLNDYYEYTDNERDEIKEELRLFMKTLAEDIIDRVPNKKIKGSYYETHYEYPALKMNVVITKWCTWANYDLLNNDTSITGFKWFSNYDSNITYDTY